MFRGDDLLKIYDDHYNHIGIATREEVHTKGLLHQVAHVWMFQRAGEEVFIYFQKRSLQRELYPGKFDLIQTTHFDPDESYEDGIIHSLDYYLGCRMNKEDIVHIGSTRQHIDQGNYHDNALVQVFAMMIHKALFVMPNTETIVKAHYCDYKAMVHGKIDAIDVYSLDDVPLGKVPRDEWWIREDEFTEVVETYVKRHAKD